MGGADTAGGRTTDPEVSLRELPGTWQVATIDCRYSSRGESELPRDAEQGRSKLRVVCVGASAGGLEALEAFFTHLPPDTGMAFVVIQHLAPDFKSLMGELLRRHTIMPIHVADNGMMLEPNTVYLIPPKADMIVAAGALLLTERDTSKGLNLPIDLFMRSLATDCGENAVGIILSGTGSDGSNGIMAVHQAGGIVLIQDPESAAFDGMPNSGIATGSAHAVLPPAEMPDFLVNGPLTGSAAGPKLAGPFDTAEEELYSPVFRMLSDHYGVDFLQYKLATISRRIDRRMRLVGCSGIEDYMRKLASDIVELGNLYEDLLIGVTEFFRDPEAWDRLRRHLFPGLFEAASGEKDREIRVWVAGTATGEEAYTVAILLTEAAEEARWTGPIRVFATDLHKASIEFASQGVYPESVAANIGPERLRRFFTHRSDGRYAVSADLRRLVVFAQNSLLTDPPFTKLDLITCRNVLIYLQPGAQRRALSLFHFGLRRGGGLMLGPSEALGDLESEFDTLDRRYKIYTKRRDGRLPVALRDLRPTNVVDAQRYAFPYSRPGSSTAQQDLMRAYDTLLDQYMPPSYLVDAAGNLIHTFGRASELLQAPSGRSTMQLEMQIVPELRMALSTALRRVDRDGEPVSFGGIRVQRDGGEVVIRLIARPLLKQRRDGMILVVAEFEESPPLAMLPPSTAVPARDTEAPIDTDHIRYLEAELRYAREHLQATIEELETTNEELQATNEELMASNEELQSSNEELHSVNEELYTVNREYEDKIEELTQLTADMENLLHSTQIGTVFLDSQLRVRRFTAQAVNHFNLMAQDVGRPLLHLTRNFEYDDLETALREVLTSNLPRQAEIRHDNGSWYLMRLHPYRTASGATNGIVLTFIDIQTIKLVGASLLRRSEELQSFAYAVSHDLQEPVRMIVGYADLYERKFATNEQASDAKVYLQYMREGAAKLRGMLDGLLQFSRVDSRGAQLGWVDLNAVAKRAIDGVQQLLDSVDGSIEVNGELPVVFGDETQLIWLLRELIDNAVKYRAAEAPSIRISARRAKDQLWAIDVADNGAGIPDTQVKAAFEIFKRVDVDTQQGGLGIGLAVARRIVDRHGGDIQATRREAGGTRITFTLQDAALVASSAGIAPTST